jgi:methionyl-tRNA synthetase
VAYYVTTPIYYVNAAPHLGHAYTTIAADVMARHMRQRGEEVFFLTGTDEHGEPVAQAAERAGVTPRELADGNARRFKDLMPVLEASNDFFIRTSDPQHEARVQEVLQRVHDNGFVYKGLYEGWYCPRCADFKSESEIGTDNTCPIHGIPLEWEHEENWFFRLSAFQRPLEDLFDRRKDFVAPPARYNEAKAFIDQGLQDVSLTRAKLRWGVSVPWDENQVFYVWFDALLNYYTALSYADGGNDLTQTFWPATYHLIGKDILKFHAIYWPALLMAAQIEPPQHLYVHGFLLQEGQKMSKSLGNVIDPIQVIEAYGADALRHYLLRDVSFGQDGSVSTTAFESRYEAELANEYGNLASRSVAMVHRYREGVVPRGALDPALDDDLAIAQPVADALDRVDLTGALDRIWHVVRRLNRYVEEQAPWQLARDEARSDDLDRTLRSLIEGLRVVTVLLHAYMPQATETVLSALGQPVTDYAHARFGAGEGGSGLGRLEPLFPKR